MCTTQSLLQHLCGTFFLEKAPVFSWMSIENIPGPETGLCCTRGTALPLAHLAFGSHSCDVVVQGPFYSMVLVPNYFLNAITIF